MDWTLLARSRRILDDFREGWRASDWSRRDSGREHGSRGRLENKNRNPYQILQSMVFSVRHMLTCRVGNDFYDIFEENV